MFLYLHHILRATATVTANIITTTTTTSTTTTNNNNNNNNNNNATVTDDNYNLLQFGYLTSLKKICSGKLE